MVDVFRPARAQIVYNTEKKTLAQLKEELGCTHIVNAGFFDMSTFRPLMWLVLDGRVLSSDQYRDWGLVIEDGLPVMSTDHGGDYLSLVPLLKNGEKLRRNLTPDVARKAERTAVGWTKDGRLILAVTDAVTAETLQEYMLSYGAVDAMMCDGGGSAQGIFPDGRVDSARRVPTLLAVWEKTQKTDQQKVIDLAKAQVGTVESPKGSNKVRYNTWYYGREVSGSAYPWCMAFVQWVFAHAGMALPYKTASCSALLNWYKKNRPGQVHDAPKAGDIVIYDWGHTGIVTEVISSTAVRAVEGNTSATIVGSQDNGGGVYERSRQRSKVSAYIRPYKEDEKVTVTLNVLRRGSKGEQVKALQQLLNACGYSCGKADGDFGSGTESALKKYQKAKNLSADGICGQATWSALLGA